jgi:predicted helicase
MIFNNCTNLLKINIDHITTLDDFYLLLHQLYLEYNSTVLIGNIFEELIFHIFKSHKSFITRYKEIWLYREIPLNILNELNLPLSDHGIDILLLDHEDCYTPIQCKYKHSNSAKLTWRDVSTFITLVSASNITKNIKERIVVTNTVGVTPIINKYSELIKIMNGNNLKDIIDDDFIAQLKLNNLSHKPETTTKIIKKINKRCNLNHKINEDDFTDVFREHFKIHSKLLAGIKILNLFDNDT